MNIQYEKLFLEVNREELVDIYYALKRSIELSIQEHWKNYPDIFEEREGVRLRLLEKLSPFANDSFKYDLREIRNLLVELRKIPEVKK